MRGGLSSNPDENNGNPNRFQQQFGFFYCLWLRGTSTKKNETERKEIIRKNDYICNQILTIIIFCLACQADFRRKMEGQPS